MQLIVNVVFVLLNTDTASPDENVLVGNVIVPFAFDCSTNLPTSLVLERGTKFSTIVDGVQYIFSSLQSQTAIISGTRTFTFSNVEIAEEIGKSATSLYKTVDRIRKKLKSCIESRLTAM